jgi:cobalt transporter subunit CbtB
MMTTQTHALPLARAEFAPLLAAVFAGLALVYFAGLSQAAALHNAAHDVRHSVAFPCH